MDELPVLIDDILEQLGRPEMTVDEASLTALQTQSWPGNVRQLRNIIQTALVESDGAHLALERALGATAKDGKPERASDLYDDAKRDFDRRFYTALYARFHGNLSKIAKAAGKQRVTVRAALRALGLSDDEPPTKSGT
jgi:DNA-binding NtrC family response regulator